MTGRSDSWFGYYYNPFAGEVVVLRIGTTTHTAQQLRTLQSIRPMPGDVAQISDLDFGVFAYTPEPGVDDGTNVVVQTIGTETFTWRRIGA